MKFAPEAIPGRFFADYPICQPLLPFCRMGLRQEKGPLWCGPGGVADMAGCLVVMGMLPAIGKILHDRMPKQPERSAGQQLS